MSKSLVDMFMTGAMSDKVKISDDVRINRIPASTTKDQVPDFTDRFKTEQGTMKLRHIQNSMLYEFEKVGGLVALAGCGTGKTLTTFLLPLVAKACHPLLIVPASLRDKTKNEWSIYAQHFNLIPIEVISYEQIQTPKGKDLLFKLSPDLIICDEAHYIKNLRSARASRLGLYLAKRQDTKFVVLSGTLMNKSIADIAHLSDWSLLDQSPFPRENRQVQVWDRLINGEASGFEYIEFKRHWQVDGLAVKESIYKRLATCDGVVLTGKDIVPSSLNMFANKLQVPRTLIHAINQAFNEKRMADALGDFELDIQMIEDSQHLWKTTDAFALRAYAQMMMGFLYVWDWPNGPDEEWLTTRSLYGKAIRQVLDLELEGIDSPAMVEQNVDILPIAFQKYFLMAKQAWDSQKHKEKPPTKCIWLDDYFVEAIKAWVLTREDDFIIWVGMSELGNRLEQELGIPYYKGGTEIPTQNSHRCIASIKSHGTGKNLQAWNINLIAHPLSDPATWEQLLARTHRHGQEADEVEVYYFSHGLFGSSMWKARQGADTISRITGQEQRLKYATYS